VVSTPPQFRTPKLLNLIVLATGIMLHLNRPDNATDSYREQPFPPVIRQTVPKRVVGKLPGCEGFTSFSRGRLGGLNLAPMAVQGNRPTNQCPRQTLRQVNRIAVSRGREHRPQLLQADVPDLGATILAERALDLQHYNVLAGLGIGVNRVLLGG
jgi:hypothetical protein